MELAFETDVFSYLETVLSEQVNPEVTAELRIPEGYPDVEKILGAWGQPIVRNREWHADALTASGGVMVWVLYQGEDGTCRCVDLWTPFSASWDLPPESREGKFRVQAMVKLPDCRVVSARKISVRAGLCLYAQAFSYAQGEIARLSGKPEGVELMQTRMDMRLNRETGEKSFALEETFPPVFAEGGQLVYCHLSPEVLDCRVLGQRMAFRGCGNLHTLYMSSDGELQAKDYPLNFSQFAELEQEYGAGASGETILAVTALEPELTPEGLHIRCTLCAQYTVDDISAVEFLSDAYAVSGNLRLKTRELDLPRIRCRDAKNVEESKSLSMEAKDIVDVFTEPEFPRVLPGEKLAVGMGCRILCRDAEGKLQSTASRWDSEVPADAEGVFRTAFPNGACAVQADAGSREIRMQLSTEFQATAMEDRPVTVICAMDYESVESGPHPGLILRRAGQETLWDIAKGAHSTMEAIRSANSLESDPLPGQMLLIPVFG